MRFKRLQPPEKRFEPFFRNKCNKGVDIGIGNASATGLPRHWVKVLATRRDFRMYGIQTSAPIKAAINWPPSFGSMLRKSTNGRPVASAIVNAAHSNATIGIQIAATN